MIHKTVLFAGGRDIVSQPDIKVRIVAAPRLAAVVLASGTARFLIGSSARDDPDAVATDKKKSRRKAEHGEVETLPCERARGTGLLGAKA